MKLEIKHLAPYLPYLLQRFHKVSNPNGENITALTVTNLNETLSLKSKCDYFFKPILRPLSDLAKEIEIKGERTDFECGSNPDKFYNDKYGNNE